MKSEENFIKFLGTAGARFVMISQLRSSAGLWLAYKGTNLLIDPGPGTLVHCAKAKPKLIPSKLDGIILTHRHLDHCGDINAMIEAMTEGGFKRKGVVFLPKDCLDEDPVILRHASKFLEKVEILEEERSYSLGAINFTTPLRHIHPTETYGLKFHLDKASISLISDTKYFQDLEKVYKADILIINTVFSLPHPQIEHLCLEDVKRIIKSIKPKISILTHFGMTMLKARPHLIAQNLREKLNIDVISAYDGMKFQL